MLSPEIKELHRMGSIGNEINLGDCVITSKENKKRRNTYSQAGIFSKF